MAGTVRRAALFAACLVGLSLAVLGLPAVASAQIANPLAPAATPPPAPPPDLEALAKTLEDPAARDQLVASIRALAAAQKSSQPQAEIATEDLFQSLVDQVTEQSNNVSNALVELGRSFNQLPAMAVWFVVQVQDPVMRDIWSEVARNAGMVLLAGLLCAFATIVVVTPTRHKLGRATSADLHRRLIHRALSLLLEFVPIVIFTLVSVAALDYLAPSPTAKRVAAGLIGATVLFSALVAVTRTLVAPSRSAHRLLEMDDGAARAIRRLTFVTGAVAIFGYLFLDAGSALGLPNQFRNFLSHVLFLIVLVALILTIWRWRSAVADSIRTWANRHEGLTHRYLPWSAFAEQWHIMASLWLSLLYIAWALEVPGGFTFLVRATILTMAIFFIADFLRLLLDQRMAVETASQPADPEGLLPVEPAPGSQYRRFGRLALIGLIRFMAILALLEVWNLGVVEWMTSSDGRVLLDATIRVTVTLLVIYVIWEITNRAIARYLAATDAQGNPRHSNRSRTLAGIVRNVAVVALSMTGLLLVLSEIGVQTGPLLAGAGVIGVAIGFGSQKLVNDIITGLFILLGDTIRIGDVVDVGGKSGAVEAMSMRTVTLRDFSGSVHTIPYSTITVVTNLTKDFSYYVFDVAVADNANVDQVVEVLNGIGERLRREWPYRRYILEPLEIAGVDSFREAAVVIKARIKTRAGDQWTVGREFNRRMKAKFEEAGIAGPVVHRHIHITTADPRPAVDAAIDEVAPAGAARAS